jgi:putative ABC transport system permease protein
MSIEAVKGLMPQGLFPSEAVVRMNIPVLAFSLGVAVFTAVVFGLVPALQTARKNMADPLKDSGRGIVGGFRRGKLRSVLVVCEVALSLVLLAGAGLLIRNFVKLQSVDLGLDPNNILVARLPLPRDQYKTAASKQQFFEALLPRLHALPGVVAATETSTLPPYGGIGTDIDIPGKTHTERWEAIYQLCSDGYFRTLGLKTLRGRTLSASEVSTARKVAVINQTFANKYFAGENPIGRQIVLKMMQKLQDGKRHRDSFLRGHRRHRRCQEQRHHRPDSSGSIHPVHSHRRVRARDSRENAERSGSAAGCRAARNLGRRSRRGDYPHGHAERLSQAVFVCGAPVQPRVLSVFASVGLVLVAIGVYSVIAYTVARQTREIGIRMALGAGRRDVLKMVSLMGLKLIAIGAAVGLLASFGATRFIASQLTGVSPHDPLTLAGVIVLMTIVGVAACFFPAQKASRVDPLVALRTE